MRYNLKKLAVHTGTRRDALHDVCPGDLVRCNVAPWACALQDDDDEAGEVIRNAKVTSILMARQVHLSY